jgi:predicted nucleotidyltransferase
MHYRSMAKSNFREFLQGEHVRFKKYLYVLRPLFCAHWIMLAGTFPPVDFNDLIRDLVDTFDNGDELRASLSHLLDLKRASSEVQDGPRDPVLHAFIERQLARTDTVADNMPDQTEVLNDFFRATVRHSWCKA